ncbi:hypothetical protein [Pendulispora albinea]|uniref:Lipoprotein n=1 Tax=Pendulispora albinea TaxID=2741071 RepID=A0ABZ2LWK1_9BACT
MKKTVFVLGALGLFVVACGNQEPPKDPSATSTSGAASEGAKAPEGAKSDAAKTPSPAGAASAPAPTAPAAAPRSGGW